MLLIITNIKDLNQALPTVHFDIIHIFFGELLLGAAESVLLLAGWKEGSWFLVELRPTKPWSVKRIFQKYTIFANLQEFLMVEDAVQKISIRDGWKELEEVNDFQCHKMLLWRGVWAVDMRLMLHFNGRGGSIMVDQCWNVRNMRLTMKDLSRRDPHVA